MSVESMSRALRVPDLSPAEKLLLVGIANHDGDGGAWPSIETLATYLCCTERNVQLTLRKLEARGLVSVDAQSGGTGKTRADRRPNLYRLHLDGVNSASPRSDDGVKPDASRGEAQRVDGVKPASPEPSLKHPEPSAESLAVAFDAFWSMYPRKVGKPSAERAFRKAMKNAVPSTIILGLEAWAGAWARVETNMRFIPHPATWLNREGWNDEPPEPDHPSMPGLDDFVALLCEFLAEHVPTCTRPEIHGCAEVMRRWGAQPGDIAVRMAVMARGNPRDVCSPTALSRLDRVRNPPVIATLDDMRTAYAAGRWEGAA